MSKIPDSIGKYKIVSLVAKGGMGAVFKAIHPTLKRYVILKQLTLRGDATVTERFKREARIMMDFKNEHIVNVYDHFKEGSSYYIVVEFVDGLSLDVLIDKESPLPDDVALLIFLFCCRALQYAHDRKVVHRDIKPGNILISKKGEVKLVDFGIATAESEDDTGLTSEGATLGTPSYMAPEQFEDSKSVDSRADIYSMGVMLYEMVTGRKPYPGTFSPEAIALIQKGKYTPPKRINPRVSPLVTRIIRRCMKEKAKKRFQDLKGVIRLIQQALRTVNPSLVRQRLVAFVRGEQGKAAPRKAFGASKVPLVAALVLIFLLGGSSYAFFSRGYSYELLMPQSYGALAVSVKVKKGFKAPEDTFLNADLFLDKGKSLPKVEDVRFRFKENKARETEDHFFLESQKVYIKSDHYRIKVNLENQVFWDTFYLHPRSRQRQTPAAREARTVEVTLEQMPSLPLSVNFTVVNQLTGEDITDATNIYIFWGSTWMKWSEWISRTLVTNERYQFKLGNMGFLPRQFDLIIAPYQSRLDLHVSLIPEPGTIKVISNHSGLKLLLDGSPTYLAGGEEGTYRHLGPSSTEVQIIELPPGDYTFTAQYSQSLSRSAKVRVESRVSREISLDFNPDKKILLLDVTR